LAPSTSGDCTGGGAVWQAPVLTTSAKRAADI
jgi:hypothetical protein